MKIKMFFVRRRFVKKYQTKKRLLIVFLIFLNCYVIWNIARDFPPVEIKWSEPLVYENKPITQDVVVIEKKLTIEDKIEAVFGSDARIALAIAKSESGLKNVKGDQHIEFIQDGKVMGHSCGLFQVRVLEGRPNCEELMDEDTNIAYAKKIFDKVGWSAWSNYKNGKYIAFLE